MKYHKKIATVLLICFAIIAFCPGFAEVYDESFIAWLQDYSLIKAGELCSSVSLPGYDERYMSGLDDDLRKSFTEIEASSPDYMFLLSFPEDMDLNAVLEEYALSDSLGAAFCFDSIYDANSVFTDNSFAEWAERSSIYGITERTNDCPPVVYTVFVYSENAPQVVTAFYGLDKETYITKTAFVYNENIEPESIYAAFPYVALHIWGDLDSATIDLRK